MRRNRVQYNERQRWPKSQNERTGLRSTKKDGRAVNLIQNYRHNAFIYLLNGLHLHINIINSIIISLLLLFLTNNVVKIKFLIKFKL